jgi:hypothetical protein
LAITFGRNARKPNACTVYQHKLKGIRRRGRPRKSLGGTVSILLPETGHGINADVTNTAALPISALFANNSLHRPESYLII